MHTNEPREDPLVEMGYEIRDVDFPKLRTAAICFFGFTGFCAIVGSILYSNRYAVFGVAKPEESKGAMVRPLPASIYPLLQDNVTSKTDISVLREQETVRMTGTGYNDDKTTVHIPVDRAMDIIIQRGLPDVKSTVPAVIKGNTPVGQGTTDLKVNIDNARGMGSQPSPYKVPSNDIKLDLPSGAPSGVPIKKPPLANPPFGGPAKTMPATKPHP